MFQNSPLCPFLVYTDNRQKKEQVWKRTQEMRQGHAAAANYTSTSLNINSCPIASKKQVPGVTRRVCELSWTEDW